MHMNEDCGIIDYRPRDGLNDKDDVYKEHFQTNALHFFSSALQTLSSDQTSIVESLSVIFKPCWHQRLNDLLDVGESLV